MRAKTSIIALAVLTAFTACKPAPSDSVLAASTTDSTVVGNASMARSTTAPAPDAATNPFAARIGAQCEDVAAGRGCTAGNLEAGDFYDIELTPGCGVNGLFAGVLDEAPSLLDTLPVTGSKAGINARLSKDQFLCVQAIARAGQEPAYYYVAAISPSIVEACESRAACKHYGDHPVKFEYQSSTNRTCALDPNAHATADCGQGWINSKSVEVFKNDP